MANVNVRGVWPVMLTPFREDRGIDWTGLDALIEWYLAAGVSGLFAVCLSSEMYELSPEERVRLAAHVVNRVAGRVPVVAAGAFGESGAVQAEAARRIAATGVTAVVLTVNQLAAAEESDADWQTHAAAMFDACADIPLGFYECPAPYHRKLSPALLGWAARSGRVLFLKDTCCVLSVIRAKLDAIRGTSLGWYNAHCPSLLPSLRLGGHGFSGIAANLYPDLFVRLCAEFTEQPEETERLQRFLTLTDMTIRHRYPVLAKRWLGMQGLPIGETCRLPIAGGRTDDDERLILENLREAVAEIAGRASRVARPARKETS
jgi:4-hydroxy-tetrahydrodipicolinate synthase